MASDKISSEIWSNQKLNVHHPLVKTERRADRPGTIYDANIVVLIHYAEQYRERLAAFKRYGLINLHKTRTHLTVLSSLGDGEFVNEIMAGWPPHVDVSFLEMTSHWPIPKINGYYLWLKETGIKARWHIRVDDDSLTDVDRTLEFVDARYGSMPIHLMTSPYFITKTGHQFTPFLERRGFQLQTLPYEHESSVTSEAAMKKMYSSEKMVDMLEETAAQLQHPGDQALAIAMHALQIPVARNPRYSYAFNLERLRLTGGDLLHIHYVNWGNKPFVECLEAILHGETRPIDEAFVRNFADQWFDLGQCAGNFLCHANFRADGKIQGTAFDANSTWRFTEDSIAITKSDQFIMIVFNRLVVSGSHYWLFGASLEEPITYYLKLPKDAINFPRPRKG